MAVAVVVAVMVAAVVVVMAAAVMAAAGPETGTPERSQMSSSRLVVYARLCRSSQLPENFQTELLQRLCTRWDQN